MEFRLIALNSENFSLNSKTKLEFIMLKLWIYNSWVRKGESLGLAGWV